MRESRLARAYISAVARDPISFVAAIDPCDEMYLYTKRLAVQKETASYRYCEAGRECLYTIERIMRACGKSFDRISSFLDFACGYGRLARFLVQEIDPSRVWVSDIYHRAVDFQIRHFKCNGFYSVAEPGELELSRRFEVVYAGSLFSHLPEHRFVEWLRKLYAVVDEDGVLIFSTHGESLLPAGERCSTSGFMFQEKSESGTLPTEEYGSSFVSKSWVENLAHELGIKSLHFFERELCEHQDVYVAARTTIPGLDRLRPRNCIRGHVDLARIEESRDLLVAGWAFGSESGAPVERVTIFVEGERLGSVQLGLARPDVAEHFTRPDCLASGWVYQGGAKTMDNVIGSCQSDCIVVTVLIENADGDIKCLLAPCNVRFH